MTDFEKLGAFYLGREYDIKKNQPREDLLLYDSKDLTTHALCVGMTGSGKTGLCVSLLEEALIDGIPAIAIDPKGDLGNLLLTFPELQPEDFRPWIDEGDATRAGMSADQYAAKIASRWEKGLASWGQTPDRIQRFVDSGQRVIYTPASNAGRPLTVLRSLEPPPAAILEDAEAYRERISATSSGLLALLGIDADPIQSREHILFSSLLDHAWREGKSLTLADLIRSIQAPPFDRVGVFDLETFYPAKDRVALSMRLNNLLASPSFAGWLEGEPLNIRNLLYTEDGRPKLSIISIAHLGEAERMFFVTILLNELLAWVRTQAGTSSLRALFYMDEIFGYFPPIANPPSKTPMLTLLKQARAYGVGIVLATQNPVDLDYKGLANTGTWLLGRLQTQRDKDRVLDGLEGASTQAGHAFDRAEMDQILSDLSSRVFVMNNVHEDEPVVFQTRWALSYLRGPLTRDHIRALTAAQTANGMHAPTSAKTFKRPAAKMPGTADRPIIPPDVDEVFFACVQRVPRDAQLVYRPGLLGRARLHFVRSTYKVDHWEDRVLLVHAERKIDEDPWDDSVPLSPRDLDTQPEAAADARFATVPAIITRASTYAGWQRQLKEHLYREAELPLFRCKLPKAYSEPGETEGDFRIRLTQAAHERRDLEVEKLRKKYASKLKTLKGRILSARQAVDRETDQYNRAKSDSFISIGSSLLGALFGRKLASRTNVGRAATAARSAGRASQQKSDIARAEEKVSVLEADAKALEVESAEAIQELQEKFQVDALELENLSVTPRKGDMEIEQVALAWLPWAVTADGDSEPLFELV